MVLELASSVREKHDDVNAKHGVAIRSSIIKKPQLKASVTRALILYILHKRHCEGSGLSSLFGQRMISSASGCPATALYLSKTVFRDRKY